MICTTSATYAYFAISATNNVATGTAATAGLTLTVTEAALKTTTNSGVMVPQKEAYLSGLWYIINFFQFNFIRFFRL